MQLVTGKQEEAQRVIIYGPSGIGKSTLAAQFPKPLFIDIEGSTGSMDVVRTRKPSSWSMLLGQVNEIRSNNMGFQTLVIDSIGEAESMCKDHVLATNQMASIEDFGYGKGYTKHAEEFKRFLDRLSDVAESGVNIVLVGHSEIVNVQRPDESGAYDKWDIKLEKKVCGEPQKWATMVLFCNYEVYVVEDPSTKKKKAQGGKRVIHTEGGLTWEAKQREGHNLPAKLQFPKTGAFAQIAHCFPVAENITAVTPEPEPVEPDPAEEVHSNMPEPAAEPTGTKVPMTDPTAFPAALFDLMTANDVQESEIQQVVAAKGYYPLDTPIGNYDETFVNGVLVAAWEQVFAAIKTNRKEAA